MKLVGISLNILYLSSALLTYLLNPGIIYKLGKKRKKKYCKICNYEYPLYNKISHCQICGVCVIG